MSQTPAGWYVDAQGTTRWWDGTQWTEQTQPSAPPPAPPAPPATPATPAQPGSSAPGQVPPAEEPDDRTRVRPAFRPEQPAAPEEPTAPEQPAAPTSAESGAISMEKPAAGPDSEAPESLGEPAAPSDDSPTYVGAVPPPPGAGTGSPWGPSAPGTPPGTPPGAPAGSPPGPPPGAPPFGAPPFGAPPWQQGPGVPTGSKVKPWMLITGGGVVLAIIVVIVLLLIFSGGGSSHDAASAPKDASVSEFCDSMSWLKEYDSDKAPSDDQLHSWQDDMDKVGTPSDMPSDARAGWEKFVNADDVNEVKGFDDNDKELSAMAKYYVDQCF